MITERILKLIDIKGITKYKFCKDLGFSNGFLDKPREIGTDKYANILEYIPDVNPAWLLTGTGEMLKKQEKTAVNQSIFGNNNKNNQLAGGNINSYFQSEMEELKKQLAEKDKTINSLIKQQEKLINKLTQQ